MIRKIQRLKSFGVFEDFQWAPDLPVFNKYNLIYGWNYSGKTTISRALRCFELKTRHPDFPSAEVNLELDGGGTCNLSEFRDIPRILVFNSDFVKENIHFEEGQANPIFILGQKDIDKQKTLTTLKVRRETLGKAFDESNQKQKAIDEGLEKGLSEKAR